MKTVVINEISGRGIDVIIEFLVLGYIVSKRKKIGKRGLLHHLHLHAIYCGVGKGNSGIATYNIVEFSGQVNFFFVLLSGYRNGW
jgi:hypothetical protein